MNENDKKTLNEALCLEISCLESYEKSGDELCAQICEIRKKGVELLKNLAKKYRCELDFEPKNLACAETKECLLAEKEICEFYEKACENIENEELKDICFRLWATSNNDYAPAFFSCFNEQKAKFDISNTQILNEDMLKFLDDVKKISQKNATADDIRKTVNSPHFSFFCGIAAGGLLAAGISEYVKEKKDEQISK